MLDTNEVTFVAAASGFDVLTFLPGNKQFTARPVVAWAILAECDGFLRAFPVAVGEAWSMNQDLAVRLPSGEVVCSDLEWATIDEWLAHMAKSESEGPPPRPQTTAPVLALDAFRNKFHHEA